MKIDEINDKEMSGVFFPSNYLPIQEGQQEFFAPVITFSKLLTSQVVLNSYSLLS